MDTRKNRYSCPYNNVVINNNRSTNFGKMRVINIVFHSINSYFTSNRNVITNFQWPFFWIKEIINISRKTFISYFSFKPAIQKSVIAYNCIMTYFNSTWQIKLSTPMNRRILTYFYSKKMAVQK